MRAMRPGLRIGRRRWRVRSDTGGGAGSCGACGVGSWWRAQVSWNTDMLFELMNFPVPPGLRPGSGISGVTDGLMPPCV